MKRPYEITVVLRILSNEDETQAAINQIVAWIENKRGEESSGIITRIDRTRLGRRKLAYEIDGQRDGLYLIFYADIEPNHMHELDLNLRLFNPVLRYLVIRDEGKHEDEQSTKPRRTSATIPTAVAAPPADALATSSEPTSEPETADPTPEEAEVVSATEDAAGNADAE